MSGWGVYESPDGSVPDDEKAAPGEARTSDAGGTYEDPNRSDGEAGTGYPGTTQDGAVMDTHDSSLQEKIDGIVAQTRVDVADKPSARIDDVLRQRLSDAGITLDDAAVTELTARISRR